MKREETSRGSLRERWAEHLAGAASAEEMRMWPLMLRTLALNLRAGIPLQEAVLANPGSGQSGENLESGTGKTPAKKTATRKSTRPRRTRAPRPSPKSTGRSGAPKISVVSRRRLPHLPPGAHPHTSPAPSYSKTAAGCARTAATACTTCS